MKSSQSLFVLLLFCLCNIGCRDDEFSSEETNIPIDTGVIVEGNLNGIIINGSNRPIPQVRIEVRGETTFTDENGFFRFEGINLDNNGSLVKISKEGYFNSYKFATAEPGEDSYIKHLLSERGGFQFPSAAEVSIPLNGGGDITMPANSIIYEDGTPYNGRVSGHHLYYDPTDSNLAAYMPGDLRGLDENGNLVQLATYGMIAIELESETGEPLQISDTLPATLRYPFPDNFPLSDTIPMWFLDEDTGHWIEEGYAVKEGDFMVAKVKHFSFWNCDVPFPLIKLTGTVVDQNGTPLANQLISISTENRLTGTGLTNENGHFRGKVPQGLDLTLSITECDDQSISTSLGPIDTDTDLGNVELPLESKITINTRLVDCTGDPISGYAFVQTDVTTDVILTDENGNINHSLLNCMDGEGFIRGIDLANGIQSDDITFSISNSDVNLDDISVCDNSIGSGTIKYNLGGEEIILTEIEVTIVDDTYLYIYGKSEPDLVQIQLMFLIEGQTHFPLGEEFLLESFVVGFDQNGEIIEIRLDPNDIDAIQSTPVQEVGDALVGNLQISFLDLEMDLEVISKISTGTIRGKRWIDTNLNGIKEIDELWSPDLADFKTQNTDPTQRLDRYYKGMPISTQGDYLIHGLLPNNEYRLIWDSGPSSITVSPAFQGTDDTQDSDFVLSSAGDKYETEYFFVNEGETIDDIGFGYIIPFRCKIEPRCCPVDGMTFTVNNGTAPYTVNLSKDGQEFGPFVFQTSLFDISNTDFGEYEIQIVDGINNACTTLYSHNETINTIEGQFWQDIDGGTANEFDPDDTILIDETRVNLLDNSGAIIATTTTGIFGKFLFSNFANGSYRVQPVLQDQFELVDLGDPTIATENHIDPQTGLSRALEFGGSNDITYDITIGIREK